MDREVKNSQNNQTVSFSVEVIEQLVAQGKIDEARKLIDLYNGIKQLKKDEEEREKIRRMQESQLRAIQAEAEYREAIQEACQHLKENGRPALGGLKDSKGVTHFICLRCQKMWTDDDLPLYLRTHLPEVGGPMT